MTESDHYITSKLKVELVKIDGHNVAKQTISVPRTWGSWNHERKEDWKRGDRRLGKGGGGSVYLEECIEGECKGGRRAVKVVKKGHCDFKREIEAAMLFSHSKVDRQDCCLLAGTFQTWLMGLAVPRKFCQVVRLVVRAQV
jgi:hypothetical protein